MSTNDIQITDLLIKRDGDVWWIPDRIPPERRAGEYPTLMGAVLPEGKKWRFRCNDCSSFQGALQRTRREAVVDLVEHWNEER